jgi:hypothetical protein
MIFVKLFATGAALALFSCYLGAVTTENEKLQQIAIGGLCAGIATVLLSSLAWVWSL